MNTKRKIVAALVGAAIALTPVAASAESPFGSAKRVTLSTDQMKKVTGTYYGDGDYWGYYGQLYAYYAYTNANYAYVYDWYDGVDERYYYNLAFYYAKQAQAWIKKARNHS